MIIPALCSEGTQCFTRVDGMRTIRNCNSILELGSCQGDGCSLCTGDACNNNIYPENRLTCYQCDSAEGNGECQSTQKDTSKSLPCLSYDKEDSCFTIKTNNITKRGCISDTSDKCDKTTNCTFCKGNACNRNNSSFVRNNKILMVLLFIISFPVFRKF